MPRLATPADLESIVRLAEELGCPSWPSQGPQETTSAFLRDLRESEPWAEEYQLFVAETSGEISGYLILKKQIFRSITHDSETVIRDCEAREADQRKRLLEYAAKAAHDYETQFLTFQIGPEDEQRRQQLESLGFQLESHQISVASAVCRLPQNSPYSVRPVVADDAFLIGVLNSEVLGHTLTAGRHYDMSSLTFQSMSAIMDQVSQQDSHSTGLALMKDQEMVGHLLIGLSERVGYIDDLALAPDHWGGTAVRHLMRAGSRLLFERGVPWFVGDVSASNRRALIVAQRALGFSIERQRYGLTL